MLRQKRGVLLLKRGLDIMLAATGLVATLPLMGGIALLIYADDRRPVLFKKRCLGLNNRPFHALKFRTMRATTDPAAEPLHIPSEHPQITRAGRFLRYTGLDELPQIWNILRGDMSFVGPRPWRYEHTSRIEERLPEFALTRLVRPGLTGLAQVYGTYYLLPRQKTRYDIFYMNKMSFVLDCILILKTIRIVIGADCQNHRHRFREARTASATQASPKRGSGTALQARDSPPASVDSKQKELHCDV